MTTYHFVLTLSRAPFNGGKLVHTMDGTIPVDGKTRTEILDELREVAVNRHGEAMRTAVILFFSLEPDNILNVSKEILL